MLDTKTALSLMLEKGYKIIETITVTKTIPKTTSINGYTCENCGHKKTSTVTPEKVETYSYEYIWHFDGEHFVYMDGDDEYKGYNGFQGTLTIHPDYL